MAIVSKTGTQKGYGGAPWKWVSGLTRDERDAVRAGGLVLVTGCRPSRQAPHPDLRTVRRVIAQPVVVAMPASVAAVLGKIILRQAGDGTVRVAKAWRYLPRMVAAGEVEEALEALKEM